ncbi:hypothetical protein D3C75_711430 [compost metagenome]
MRLAGELHAADAQPGIGGGFAHGGQQRGRGGAGRTHLVEAAPARGLAVQRALQRGQPAPAFAHLDVGVVEGGGIDLEEALGAAFHVDQGAIGLREAGGRQHQVGLLGGAGVLMIHHQQMLQALDGGIDPVAGGAAIEIVLQGDQRKGLAPFDALEGGFQRGGVAGQHGQPQAVGLLGHQCQFDALTTTLEGVGYVAGRLDQRLAAGTGARDDEWLLGVAKQLGPAGRLGQLIGAQILRGRG